jgi:phytoene synthase
MKADAVHEQTFKKGSKTYFNSSLFFPRSVREHVYILYGFVRVADDFVDAIPQEEQQFRLFCKQYRDALKGNKSGNVIIDSFIELMELKNLEAEWVDAFLESMEMDLVKNDYRKLDETLHYIYGSAEVIGLFMARLLDLPDESLPFAKMLGRSMQYINFIRDINEDRELGRQYLPIESRYAKLAPLSEESATSNSELFLEWMQQQVDLYRGWQVEAEKGFTYIPRRYCIPIKTASDMYKWTAEKIARNPYVVFQKKVKPGKARIMFTLVKNLLFYKSKKRGEAVV